MYGSNNRERKEKAFNIVELERIRAASPVRKVQKERKRERGEDERQLFLQKGRSFTFSHSRGARKKDSRYRVNFSSCFHSSHSIPSLSLFLSLSLLVGDRFTLRVGFLSREKYLCICQQICRIGSRSFLSVDDCAIKYKMKGLEVDARSERRERDAE